MDWKKKIPEDLYYQAEATYRIESGKITEELLAEEEYEKENTPTLHNGESMQRFITSNRELQSSLLQLRVWMSDLSGSIFMNLREEGFQVDLFAELLIDQDQMEMSLPPEFFSELARLNLPLKIISNA